MIKRFLKSIIVFFFSFVVLWIAIFALDYAASDLLSVTQDVFRVNFAAEMHDPQALENKLRAAWQEVETRNATDSRSIEREAGVAGERFAKEDKSMLEAIATVLALVGAMFFGLSCLSDGIYVALLFWRRLFTVPLIFGYGFLIFSVIYYYVGNFICLSIVKASSIPAQRAAALLDFHKGDDSWILLGVTVLAALTAFHLVYRATRWDGLPWCSIPAQPKQPKHMRKAM